MRVSVLVTLLVAVAVAGAIVVILSGVGAGRPASSATELGAVEFGVRQFTAVEDVLPEAVSEALKRVPAVTIGSQHRYELTARGIQLRPAWGSKYQDKGCIVSVIQLDSEGRRRIGAVEFTCILGAAKRERDHTRPPAAIGRPANTLDEIGNLAVGLAFEIRQHGGSGGKRDGARHRDSDFDVRPVGDDPLFWFSMHEEADSNSGSKGLRNRGIRTKFAQRSCTADCGYAGSARMRNETGRLRRMRDPVSYRDGRVVGRGEGDRENRQAGGV